MLRLKTQGMVACLLAAHLTLATGAAPVIGVAVKNGSFKVDGVKIDGNATVMEGNRIESGSGSTRLQLSNGNLLRLGSDSTGAFYRNRMVLEKGTGEVQTAAAGFLAEAAGLRVAAEHPRTDARLTLNPTGSLHVDALSGEVQVLNKAGVLLARMDAGTSLEFTPPSDGAMAPSKMSGLVRRVGEKYVLTDETSKLVVELHGVDVAGSLGERVEIEAIPLAEASTIPGVSQVVKVVKVVKLGKAGAITSHSHVHGAVIAGVAVAAAAASAGVIASQKNDTKSVSPSSR